MRKLKEVEIVFAESHEFRDRPVGGILQLNFSSSNNILTALMKQTLSNLTVAVRLHVKQRKILN